MIYCRLEKRMERSGGEFRYLSTVKELLFHFKFLKGRQGCYWRPAALSTRTRLQKNAPTDRAFSMKKEHMGKN